MSSGFGLLLTRMLALVGVAVIVGTAHSAFVRPVALTAAEARAQALRERDNASTPASELGAKTGAAVDAAIGSESGSEIGTAAPAAEPDSELNNDAAGVESADAVAAEDSDQPAFDVASLEGEITLEQAAWLHENGAATFIDARSLEEFEESHVEGAMWMPATAFDGDEPPINFYFLDNLKPVVIYCGGGDCDASKNTEVRIAFEDPTIQVLLFEEGFPAWQDADLPVGSGPDPLLEDDFGEDA